MGKVNLVLFLFTKWLRDKQTQKISFVLALFSSLMHYSVFENEAMQSHM